jgi:hypothetical protein
MLSNDILRASDIRNAVRSRIPEEQVRLHWMALSCVGMRTGDVIHAVAELANLADVARRIGFECVHQPANATVHILHRPKESELLVHVAKLKEGCRMLVYNEMSDIDLMHERSFEVVTACIFDRQSGKVVRIFDPLDKKKRTKIDSYIDVELGEINDSSLSIQASKIAALR